ncbi:DNA-3-methyladenine glycosylase 2 family protein [Ornithinimicrobium humiphilum]|uniref:DNA-3-methyladenine glycosylase II n=1 Tax=Ornithinimicrobium humiphilum TaxID=125288 RepID=A0A543KMC8_9MICO|nr:DNA-3-methyladenine glycosylase [Ornithinimicrobium humiphilum]TQM96235.1 3-methyladenine DNA glycosylase/8-oxoguanine DNA glycosylase [Ornithinimicrobium humiphilum]
MPARSSRRAWRPAHQVDVGATWGTLRRGAGDPAWRVAGGSLWRGIRTPGGPTTLRLQSRPSEGVVLAEAWGPGADWVVDRLPVMLGDEDGGARAFVPHHEPVALAMRRFPGWRVPRTGLVMEALVPAIIEQKVTGQEAFSGWRRIVQRFGEAAPGPGAALGLRVPPDPATLAMVPSWEWLRAGVSPQRSDTVVRVCRLADRLQDLPELDLVAARRRLVSVPGVGVWTAAETAQRALGDPDAVSFGDYHVAANIGWALTGHPVDDHGLVELLRPYGRERYRVQRLLELSGAFRPRRGPRMAPRRHLPVG